MSSNTLKNNAYHVLGLETTASEKDILKRSKEIANRLKIGDIPKYDYDLSVFENFRTAESVREAIQRLQTPKNRVREYFFWFQVADQTDERAFSLLKTKEYDNAVRVWEEASDGDSAKVYLHRKNLAILYTLLLNLHDDKKYLRASLLTWKSIIDSQKFWDSFSKVYKLQEEQNANQDVITDFRKHVVSYLSDIYAEFHDEYKDSDYVNDFQKIFSATGEKIEKSVLTPAYQAINGAVERLENLKVNKDGVIDKQETEQIKNLVGAIQVELNKLIDLGLYEESQTKVMRDRTASALRTIVLELHNNLSETDKAIALLNVALKIVGTASLAGKIEQEVKQLETIKKNQGLVQPINDLTAAGRYDEALQLINSEKEKYKGNVDLQEFYANQTKLCITMKILQKAKTARDYFDKSEFDKSKPLFEEVFKLIYANLSLFDINKEGIDNLITEVRSNASKINLNNIKQLDEYRASIIKVAKDKFEGKYEEMIIITLVDSCLFGGITDFFKDVKHRNSVANILYTLGWFTIWFYGIGLIFFLVGWIYKNQKSNATG